MSKILITGGTGLVGSRMTDLLLEQGHEVAYLSRSKKLNERVLYFQWDIKKEFIEAGAIEWPDYIIHLAGAGVADERWTPERKRAIMDSRTHSTALLRKELEKREHHLKAFISATAIGIYGDSGDQWVDEESPIANDFLANVCKVWEQEVDKLAEVTGLRTAKVRVGIVLSTKGGALVEISKPVKFMAGAPLGSGKQWQSWIHIDDICRLFIHAMENEDMTGAYNGVAPFPVTNEELTKAIAKELGKPLFLPNVPPFALRILMGEMAEIVLAGSKVSSKKTGSTGFKWKFPTLDGALADLL